MRVGFLRLRRLKQKLGTALSLKTTFCQSCEINSKPRLTLIKFSPFVINCDLLSLMFCVCKIKFVKILGCQSFSSYLHSKVSHLLPNLSSIRFGTRLWKHIKTYNAKAKSLVGGTPFSFVHNLIVMTAFFRNLTFFMVPEQGKSFQTIACT